MFLWECLFPFHSIPSGSTAPVISPEINDRPSLGNALEWSTEPYRNPEEIRIGDFGSDAAWMLLAYPKSPLSLSRTGLRDGFLIHVVLQWSKESAILFVRGPESPSQYSSVLPHGKLFVMYWTTLEVLLCLSCPSCVCGCL